MCLFVLQKCIYYLFIDDTSITLGSPLWRRKVSKPLYHRYRLRKNKIYSLKKKKKTPSSRLCVFPVFRKRSKHTTALNYKHQHYYYEYRLFSTLHYKPLWLTGAWGLKLNELSFPLLPETQKKKKKEKEKNSI